jgi:GTP pyrophosphokinase
LDDILADNKKQALVIGHTKKLKYQYASCCSPIPGDEVVGFVQKDGSIEVHRVNCPNTTQLMSNYGYRIVRTKWGDNGALTFLAGIKVSGFDRQGIILDITTIISNELHVNMRSISFESTDGVFEGTIILYVTDTAHLRDITNKLKTLEGILSINRIEQS